MFNEYGVTVFSLLLMFDNTFLCFTNCSLNREYDE